MASRNQKFMTPMVKETINEEELDEVIFAVSGEPVAEYLRSYFRQWDEMVDQILESDE